MIGIRSFALLVTALVFTTPFLISPAKAAKPDNKERFKLCSQYFSTWKKANPVHGKENAHRHQRYMSNCLKTPSPINIPPDFKPGPKNDDDSELQPRSIRRFR